MKNSYKEFISTKTQLSGDNGFSPLYIPDFLFDFQKYLVEWAIQKGRSAMFADCGLGKTPMQLVWAENIVRKTNKRVLILTPLAVSHQTIKESQKFSIECNRSFDGKLYKGIQVTNYERLHHFNPNDFIGVVCDESSILKSFDGTRRSQITEFMRKIPYRLLTTATAAPNDYIELGTSSEALGELGYMDMLSRFFKNDNNNSIKPTLSRRYEKIQYMFSDDGKWRFKGHAEIPFWKWVCSWARAVRKPSDLGFDDKRFLLPELIEQEHVIKVVSAIPKGMFFAPIAIGLKEQRIERRNTIKERCEKVASIADTKNPVFIMCHLNTEGDLLEKLIPDSVQISGRDSDEKKEEKFLSFINGESRVLITKPKIGAWGLNLQHCNHVIFFPSHSFEQYYQGVRRCWRFGQKKPVVVDVVSSEGEIRVLENLQRKTKQASKMFDNLILHMNEVLSIDKNQKYELEEKIPSWLSHKK